MDRTKTGAPPVVLVVDDDLAYLEKLQRVLQGYLLGLHHDERGRGHPSRSRPSPRSMCSSSTRDSALDERAPSSSAFSTRSSRTPRP
ncbi:MAG: hypothetical protein MZU79_02490 [Anaerotruncus sp.]|nr:hypothetical protein [Anaerotruncus sp.]